MANELSDVPPGGGAQPTPGGLPAATTPTWEMELLVSGATVFGLLQVPHGLDGLFYDLLNRSSEELSRFVLPLWIYAKVALLTLIGTFVLHLVLRGFWVALVGLASVYPEGIRWERMRGTPHRLAVARELPDLAARIEAADNRATRVFGVGFGLAMIMLLPFAAALLAVAITLAGQAAGATRASRWAIGILLVVVAAPGFVATMVDRRLGARIPAGTPVGRGLRRVFQAQQWLRIGRASNPLIAIFQSNEGPWRTGAVVAAVMLAASAIAIGQFSAETGGLDLGDWAGLPDDAFDASDNVYPAHYATSRGEARSPAPAPYLQDRVIRGPYLELFVPYRPRRHAPALRETCGEAVRAAEQGKPARPALDCLARLLDVRIDGARQPVRLDAATDPVTGLRGALAMIPAERLAPGRHELTVVRLANPRLATGIVAAAPAEAPDAKPDRIPFWR